MAKQQPRVSCLATFLRNTVGTVDSRRWARVPSRPQEIPRFRWLTLSFVEFWNPTVVSLFLRHKLWPVHQTEGGAVGDHLTQKDSMSPGIFHILGWETRSYQNSEENQQIRLIVSRVLIFFCPCLPPPPFPISIQQNTITYISSQKVAGAILGNVERNTHKRYQNLSLRGWPTYIFTPKRYQF